MYRTFYLYYQVTNASSAFLDEASVIIKGVKMIFSWFLKLEDCKALEVTLD